MQWRVCRVCRVLEPLQLISGECCWLTRGTHCIFEGEPDAGGDAMLRHTLDWRPSCAAPGAPPLRYTPWWLDLAYVHDLIALAVRRMMNDLADQLERTGGGTNGSLNDSSGRSGTASGHGEQRTPSPNPTIHTASVQTTASATGSGPSSSLTRSSEAMGSDSVPTRRGTLGPPAPWESGTMDGGELRDDRLPAISFPPAMPLAALPSEAHTPAPAGDGTLRPYGSESDTIGWLDELAARFRATGRSGLLTDFLANVNLTAEGECDGARFAVAFPNGSLAVGFITMPGVPCLLQIAANVRIPLEATSLLYSGDRRDGAAHMLSLLIAAAVSARDVYCNWSEDPLPSFSSPPGTRYAR